ncbi:MAG: hypothetical protein U0169_19765 [Polyangiaceae bacterium]
MKSLRSLARSPRSTSAFPTALSALTVTLATTIGACGGGNENLPPPPPPPPPMPTSLAPVATTPPAPVPSAPAAKPMAPITLLAGAASPDPTAPLPTVKFLAPTKGQVIPAAKAGEFQVKLDVKNWATATGSSHVHLILDNQPYKPLYDTKAPIKLSELPTGDALSEGQHVLVAFPSRANHESVKTKDAVAVVEFYVGKKADGVDTKKPMLVYSRPKGEYKGEMANHVLVDFQIANVTLAEGKEHVDVSVTGPGIEKDLVAKIEKFGTPWYLDNLQDGSYKIKLDLVGADGKALPGAWNSTTREIKIDHTAVAETPHEHAADAPKTDAAPAGSAKTDGKTPAKPEPKPAKADGKTPAKPEPKPAKVPDPKKK